MDEDLIREINERLILHWNYRGYVEIPEELKWEGEHIEEIYLKWNNLEKLPNWLGELRNLTNLYMCGNHLDSLPNEIEELHSLSYLDIGQNNINNLPSSIGNLSKLSVLIANGNSLTYLPDEIRHLAALRILHIAENMLISLPESLCECEDLEELCLDRNNLTSIPPQIVYLPKLSSLSLNGNQIFYLPALPFLSSPTLQFDENPRLNYLAYPLGSQIALNTSSYEADLWNIPSNGCFQSSLDTQEALQNLILQVTGAEDANLLYAKLIMPLGLSYVCMPKKGMHVPSMYELALRVVYQMFYDHKLSILSCSGNHAFSMIRKPLRRLDVIKIPANIIAQVKRGPLTICSNPECNTPIFSYAVIWIVPKLALNKSRGFMQILTVIFFCSDHCSSVCSLFSHNLFVKLDWKNYNSVCT